MNEMPPPPVPAKKRRRTPKLLKRFLQSAPFRAFLYSTIAGYIGLIKTTTRWTVVNEDIAQGIWDVDRAAVVAFWHGRNLVAPFAWRTTRTVNMLASRHRDGDITENVMKKLGLKTLRGSSADPSKGKTAKGGAAALKAMVRVLTQGESIGITPDGPRGPRMRAGAGVIAIARLAGAPIVPVAVAIKRSRVLNTWDRLVIPFPWSRGAIVWGQPVTIARDANATDMEAARLAVENGITAAQAEADRLVGRTAIEPAPEPAPNLLATAS